MRGFSLRTDLAVEAVETLSPAAAGVRAEESVREGILCSKIVIENEDVARQLGKKPGNYYTINISSLLRRESETFGATVEAIRSALCEMLVQGESDRCTLVVGLGNRDITPDNVGPLAAKHVLVTRHLKKEAPEDFKMLSPVAVITPGVMGSSGIESADYIRWVCDRLEPKQVITVDALAAGKLERLCRTVQISDTGVTPGSGVGNTRQEISRETLGVPVIAVGVPTVVDIRNLVDGNDADTNAKHMQEMIVTPRNIDSEVVAEARLVAYAVNCALHEGLKIEDIDMLVG